MTRQAFAEVDQAGLRRVLRTLEQAESAASEEALKLAGETVTGDAQNDAPVKTGALKAAHVVGEYDAKQRQITIGVNTDYALVVHETHPTKARWFVNAVRQRFVPVLRKALSDAMRKHTRRGS